MSLSDANLIATDNGLYSNGDELSVTNAAKLISLITGKNVMGKATEGPESKLISKLGELAAADTIYYVAGRIHAISANGQENYGHEVNIVAPGHNGVGALPDSARAQQPIMDTSNADRKDTSGRGGKAESLYKLWIFEAAD